LSLLSARRVTKMDGQVGSGRVLRLYALGGCRFVLEKVFMEVYFD